MTPEQLKGLWLCGVLTVSMVLMCPTLGWLLLGRVAPKA